MLMVAISMAGLSGAAAITAALALLGPGGIITLGVAVIVASAIFEFGFDALFRAVVKKLYEKGESKESLESKIRKGPWSGKMKTKAISELKKQ